MDEETPQYCSRCAAQLTPDDSFCPECGKKLPNEEIMLIKKAKGATLEGKSKTEPTPEPEAEPKAKPDPEPEPEPEPEPKPSKDKKERIECLKHGFV